MIVLKVEHPPIEASKANFLIPSLFGSQNGGHLLADKMVPCTIDVVPKYFYSSILEENAHLCNYALLQRAIEPRCDKRFKIEEQLATSS